jgi:hypothetical protein
MLIWIENMSQIIKHFSILRLRTALVLALAALMLSACGITAPRGNDGFANLDSPGMNETDRSMSISLGRTTLWFAAKFLDEEPETQALLRSIDGVRIRIYEVDEDGDTDKIADNFADMGGKLLDDGWDPVMLVREEGELTQMYMKSSVRGISGLTIVSADDEEVVVVNVLGDIDPVYYQDVMLALNVDDAPEVQVATLD